MMFLLVLTLAVSAVSVGLMGEMYRRNQPLLGLAGLSTFMVSGVLGAVYGALTSI